MKTKLEVVTFYLQFNQRTTQNKTENEERRCNYIAKKVFQLISPPPVLSIVYNLQLSKTSLQTGWGDRNTHENKQIVRQ